MKIGLFDEDNTGFPNLAIMKIARYHKERGDTVFFQDYLEQYDIAYCSKVFTFTPADTQVIRAEKIHKGGTGFSITDTLPPEIENTQPDLTLYKASEKTAYGFLTRGCVRNCPWCIVPRKEGPIRKVDSILNIAQGKRHAVLMDNNILASEDAAALLAEIASSGIAVDFNQGLDARLVTANIADLLAASKWMRYIRFACDTTAQMPSIKNAVQLLAARGIRPERVFVYTLVKEIADAYARIEFLRGLGVNPFAQPYRDFEENTPPTIEQRRFARWVNHKAIFKTVQWADYQK